MKKRRATRRIEMDIQEEGEFEALEERKEENDLVSGELSVACVVIFASGDLTLEEPRGMDTLGLYLNKLTDGLSVPPPTDGVSVPPPTDGVSVPPGSFSLSLSSLKLARDEGDGGSTLNEDGILVDLDDPLFPIVEEEMEDFPIVEEMEDETDEFPNTEVFIAILVMGVDVLTLCIP